MGKYVIVIIVIVGILLIWRYLFRSTDDSVKDVKVNVEIIATDLLQAYETDEDEANNLYLNQIIKVTGYVSEIDELESGFSVYLKDNDETSGILCGFSKKSFSDKSVIVGDSVTIKGLCTGYLLDVVLNKCAWDE